MAVALGGQTPVVKTGLATPRFAEKRKAEEPGKGEDPMATSSSWAPATAEATTEAIASAPNSSDERPRRKETGRRRGECEKGESHEEIRRGSISWSAKTRKSPQRGGIANKEKRHRRVQRR